MHLIETILIGGLGVAVAFHAYRFVGAQLARNNGAPGKVGRAVLGVFSFGTPQ